MALRASVKTPRPGANQARILQRLQQRRRLGQTKMARRMLLALRDQALDHCDSLIPQLHRSLHGVLPWHSGVNTRQTDPARVETGERICWRWWQCVSRDDAASPGQALGLCHVTELVAVADLARLQYRRVHNGTRHHTNILWVARVAHAHENTIGVYLCVIINERAVSEAQFNRWRLQACSCASMNCEEKDKA